MTDQEWLKRLDAHMERGEEIMRRSDETMRRSDETMRRSDETMRLLRADHDDLRRFIRDQNTRMERVVQRFEHRSLEAEKRFAARMDDMGDQLRANTAATWAMVDEIRGWSR